MMAWTALQILATAASLLAPFVVMAQREVVITVSYEGTSGYSPYIIGFNVSLFTEFHECLSQGVDSCLAVYGLSKCPNCNVETVNPLGQCSQESDNYYQCTNDASKATMNCQRQTEISTTSDIPLKTYLLRNSSYPSVCFGFVWTFNTEGIIFKSNQWDVEFCGANCACPSRSTTPQPGTETPFPSPSPGESVSSTPVRSSPSSSSTTSAATQGTLSTKTPTEAVTSVTTSNPSSPLTDSSSNTENSGDDPPIGGIVGAAVGVIVIIAVIIIIIVVFKRRKAGAKSPSHSDYETSAASSSNGAEVHEKTNNGKSHSCNDNEFSNNNSGLHAPNNGAIATNGDQNSFYQPSITRDGVAPVKYPHKPQFAIKDNDSDFGLGYSKAQLVVSEDNNNTKGKKTHDNYDYVYAEDDVKVPDPDPKTTRNKTTVVIPPKVKYDYAVIDKTGNNKNHGNDVTDTDLTNNHYFILEEDYGYLRAEGDAAAQGTNDAAVGKAHATVPTGTLPGTSDQDFGYEYAQAIDGYTTVRDVNQSNPNNDDPNTKNVYSRLHEEIRDIQNPYDVGPKTDDVYSKLHEEVKDIKNPYNILCQLQGASDSNDALPDTANGEHDTEEQIKTT